MHLPGQKCPAGHLTEHLIMECFLLFSCLIGLIGNNSDIKLGKENVQNRPKKTNKYHSQGSSTHRT
jgi:hypothetical protein